jgi:MFS family permease
MAVMGFGAGMAGPSRDLLVRRASTSKLGRSSFGRVYGFVYSGVDIGLATAPVLAGPLLDAGHFQAALVAVAVLQLLAIAAAWRVAQPDPAARSAVERP